MLTITTIYFANLEAIKDPLTNKILKNEVSDLEGAERKVVVVYAGSAEIKDQASKIRDSNQESGKRNLYLHQPIAQLQRDKPLGVRAESV